MKLFCNRALGLGGDVCLKIFLGFFLGFFWLWMPFCLAKWHHFSILVESHLRNIPVKLFQNPLTGLGEDVSEKMSRKSLRKHAYSNI